MKIHLVISVCCLIFLVPSHASAPSENRGTKVLFIRHAEAGNNIITHMQEADAGFTYPLTEIGIHQARDLAKRLENEEISRIYASARVRTIQTADAIAFSQNLAPELVPEMVEIDSGAVSGDDIHALLPRLLQEWKVNPEFRYKNGESLKDLQKRVKDFVEVLIARHGAEDGTVVVVAHGGSISLGILPLCKNPVTVNGRTGLHLRNTGILKTFIEDGELICDSIDEENIDAGRLAQSG